MPRCSELVCYGLKETNLADWKQNGIFFLLFNLSYNISQTQNIKTIHVNTWASLQFSCHLGTESLTQNNPCFNIIITNVGKNETHSNKNRLFSLREASIVNGILTKHDYFKLLKILWNLMPKVSICFSQLSHPLHYRLNHTILFWKLCLLSLLNPHPIFL